MKKKKVLVLTDSNSPGFDARKLCKKHDWECDNYYVQSWHAFTAVEKELNGIAAVLVYADLKWSDMKAPKSHQAFELIRRLRVERRLRVPFHIFGKKTWDDYVASHSKKVHTDILLAPYHAFHQVPAKGRIELEAPMSEELLQDISYHFFTQSGRASKIIHDLEGHFLGLEVFTKSNLEFDLPEQLKKIRILIDETKNIVVPEFEPELEEWYHKLEGIQQNWNGKESEAFILNELREFKGRMNAHLLGKKEPSDPLSNVTPSKNTFPWECLYIDDDEALRRILHKRFITRGLKCWTAANLDQAIRIYNGLEDPRSDLDPNDRQSIAEDVDFLKHNIRVVITDLRFVEADGQRWQPHQGYDIVRRIRKEAGSRSIAVFLLTSRSESLVRHLQVTQRQAMSLYTKTFILNGNGNGFNVFFEAIVDAGEQVTNRNEPTASTWTSANSGRAKEPLRNYYDWHRNDDQYAEAEETINGMVEDILFDGKQHDIILQGTLGSCNENVKDLDAFRYNRLLGRRIYLVARYICRHDVDDALQFIGRQRNQEVKKVYSKETVKAILHTSLALNKHNIHSIREITMRPLKDLINHEYNKLNLLEEEIDLLLRLDAKHKRKELGTDLTLVEDFYNEVEGLGKHRYTSWFWEHAENLQAWDTTVLMCLISEAWRISKNAKAEPQAYELAENLRSKLQSPELYQHLQEVFDLEVVEPLGNEAE